MIVVVADSIPPAIRGRMKLWFIEPKPNVFVSGVKDTVANGDKVSLTGFLTFDKKHVEAKTGVIQLGDKKGQTWNTPAKDEISVKISKSYKAI